MNCRYCRDQRAWLVGPDREEIQECSFCRGGRRKEQWRPVRRYEDAYKVSDMGRIRSMRTGRLRKTHAKQSGHTHVALWKDGAARSFYVHSLVLEAFVGPRPEGMQGCHYDGDATHNDINNLRWDTPTANAEDMRRHGTHNHAKKRQCIRGHDLIAPNLAPKPGARACRACALGRNTVWRNGGDVGEASDLHYRRIMAPGYKSKGTP